MASRTLVKRKPFARQLRRVRKICLGLPETMEKRSHGEPTFFVKKRVFAMFSNNHHGDGHVAVWLPAAPGLQEALIEEAPSSSRERAKSNVARMPLRFQVFPGRGTTSDEAIVDDDRVALGGVFFRAPAAPWVAGTYRRAIDHELGNAA